MHTTNFEEWAKKQEKHFQPVVPFQANTDRLLLMDFTKNNTYWKEEVLKDEFRFKHSVKSLLKENNAKFGIGGYNEYRTVYAVSEVFGKGNEEPRRLHLGIDIWGDEGTKVAAPMAGTVHSFAFNDRYGDYGATIILKHEFEGFILHTLYGHLALQDLTGIEEGDKIEVGQSFAHFGDLLENGHWPPHLHFQVIMDMEQMKGDYPGVCKQSEAEKYLNNCPNPDWILQMMRFANAAVENRF